MYSNLQGQRIYQVSELNSKIKNLLEDKYSFLWISGEISNFKIPASGHCYFTLKDAKSQISAVLFRSRAASLAFTPQNGMSVTGFGRVGVYEPRGTYQIIFEYLEPRGIGSLQVAFEKLKRQLADEGLFDAERKQPLPPFPRKIAVVTSPTGAAVRDFIHVASRRFPNLPLLVVPVRVQGEQAPGEIITAINTLNRLKTCDVIVLARGGGSIEDLWAFNDEQVARSIYSSRIPVVSAIGHETDFTIADFTADMRAPTPSAAAEIIVPSKNEMAARLSEINERLYKFIDNLLKLYKLQLDGLSDRIVHPRHKLQDWHLRLDDLSNRLNAATMDAIARRRERITLRREMLLQASPSKRIDALRTQLSNQQRTLTARWKHTLKDRRSTLHKNASMLEALNPMAILKRGYSITRTLPDRTIVRSTRCVKKDQDLEVLLGKGRLKVIVNEKEIS
jgi:exodeoxyribonuclease VII large subunit